MVLTAWLWFLFSLFISATNDIVVKSLGSHLPGFEVSFFRFFWAAFSLALLYPKTISIESWKANHKVHITRAALLCVGMGLWSSFLPRIPLSQAMIINLSIPVLSLIFGRFLLKENITTRQYLGTFMSLSGMLLTVNWQAAPLSSPIIGLFISACFFSLCDILNKISAKESLVSSLFFTALYSSLFSLLIVWQNLQVPSYSDLAFTALLGVNGNLMFYGMLKAFQTLKVSQVAPLKYFEFFLATFLGWIFFQEHPSLVVFCAASLVLIGSAVALDTGTWRKKETRTCVST